jgi:hypothetical protein
MRDSRKWKPVSAPVAHQAVCDSRKWKPVSAPVAHQAVRAAAGRDSR